MYFFHNWCACFFKAFVFTMFLYIQCFTFPLLIQCFLNQMDWLREPIGNGAKVHLPEDRRHHYDKNLDLFSSHRLDPSTVLKTRRFRFICYCTLSHPLTHSISTSANSSDWLTDSLTDWWTRKGLMLVMPPTNRLLVCLLPFLSRSITVFVMADNLKWKFLNRLWWFDSDYHW